MNRTLLTSLIALCASAALAQPPESRRSGMANPRDNDTVAAAAAAASARTINFSGITWIVKSSGGELWGPGPNNFSDAESNVSVDAQGRLHLRITHENGIWKSAEVIAQKSLGYGTYRFTIDSDVAGLDPNVVLGLFTWNDDPAFDHREIDIEFSRWGNPFDPTNAQYTVQPYTVSANLQRWTLNPGYGQTSHSFRWTKNSIVFESLFAGSTLKSWNYTRRAGVPKPGGENPRINLWLFRGAAPQNGLPVEVIISRFEHLR
ncbi:MAG: glycoside hydrolase family 16 protein [Pseudomonadota bacterium]